MIQVTTPFLPPRKEYQRLVDSIFQENWLTNNGPLLRQLETEVPAFLNSSPMQFVSNGTIALQLAIRALNLKGEIITTPFSYVATCTSIIWEHCSPVFVDIASDGYNIDARKIEQAISRRTSAILATHCFGIPCEVEIIDSIAKKHGLRVIYDGAHCFGSTVKDKSVFDFGDVTTCSFHATKLFHSVEGGGVFSSDEAILEKIALLRNFGHDGPEKFNGIGINGKNSELHAAMGMAILPYMPAILARRKEIAHAYYDGISHLPLELIDPNVSGWNAAYIPALFQSEAQCLRVKSALEAREIYARRYFYPSLDVVHPTTNQPCPLARSKSSRILCLPSFHTMTNEELDQVCKVVIDCF